AENLILGGTPDNIAKAMVAQGFAPQHAAAEVDLALRSPYLRGAERLRNRLTKRDWLLATYRKLNRLHPNSGEIERRHKLSRQEFLDEYYSTNRPVIITGMMEDWPALQKWGLDYFETKFGDREVEVQFGRNAGANYEIEREKYLSRMLFADFVNQVRNAGVTNDFYLTANNNSKNKTALPELWDDIAPLPEYLDGRDKTAGFFWFGPAGTITPFHHDLTNNFMAQVIGRKRVKIAPSWDMPLMHNYLHVFSAVDGRNLTPMPHPPLDQPQILECIIGPGDILFLPIGCLHFVEGLEISVTMSFTNFAFDNDFSSFYTTYHGV
ncbi:cupin-like domain-containing protein, partial [Singulisphaera rosea]